MKRWQILPGTPDRTETNQSHLTAFIHDPENMNRWNSWIHSDFFITCRTEKKYNFYLPINCKMLLSDHEKYRL